MLWKVEVNNPALHVYLEAEAIDFCRMYFQGNVFWISAQAFFEYPLSHLEGAVNSSILKLLPKERGGSTIQAAVIV